MQKDYNQVKAYREAADQGDVRAMNNLGICYHTGKEVAENHATVFLWYMKAAELGDTSAFKKGMSIGGVLVSATNDYAVSKGLKIKPVCSFASVWYERHPQFEDILDKKD